MTDEKKPAEEPTARVMPFIRFRWLPATREWEARRIDGQFTVRSVRLEKALGLCAVQSEVAVADGDAATAAKLKRF